MIALLAESVETPSTTQTWLSFISTLIWQLILVAFLLSNRKHIVELFRRLTKLGFAGIETQFQVESATAIHATASVEVQKIGSDGFLTKGGIEDLIAGSGLLQGGEKVKSSLLLFRTQFQRTWLVSTGKTLFCVLDDPNTRESGQLIQWREATESIKRIATWEEEKKYAIDIGKHGSWLYSHYLHPDSAALKQQVRGLLSS